MFAVRGVLLLLIAMCSSFSVEGYKILIVCPMPTKSHNNLCRGISSTLLERGHEVTFVGAFAKNNTKSREIVIDGLEEIRQKMMLNVFEKGSSSIVETTKLLDIFMTKVIEKVFLSKELMDLYENKNEHFDAYVLEYFFNTNLIGFGVRFNCPTIILSPVSMMTLLTTMTDNPLAHAIVPNVFSTYSAHMSLWERVASTSMTIMQEILGVLYLDRSLERGYNKHFPRESKRVPYAELKYQIASTLVNSHPSAGIVRPLLPNTIEIGGYHIKDAEPLPDDIKAILDAAKDGAIFFSMGSNMRSSEMNPKVISAIMNSFAALKQTVLWKFEKDLPGKPKNVIINDWLPQTGILNHPNVKLFISHGGLLSCTEATHFGKPMLIIPVYGDQHHNALEVTQRGQGFSLSYENISESSLKWALNEALTNEKYIATAEHLQKLFLDRPVKPRDLAAFQIEHVIRTKGAPHLSPPRLPRYSQLLMDVAAVVLIPLVIFVMLVVYCCKFLCKRCKRTEQKIKKH